MELEALRAQVANLEQLLATHEEAEQAHNERTERMIVELKERAEQLSQSESALRRQSIEFHLRRRCLHNYGTSSAGRPSFGLTPVLTIRLQTNKRDARHAKHHASKRV